MMEERRWWRRLASHFHTPLQRFMRETSSSEFVEWIEHLHDEKVEQLKQERTRRTKEEFYLAQIAMQIERGYMREGTTTCLKQFLLNFEEEVKEAEKPLSAEQKQEQAQRRMEMSKAAWFGLVHGAKVAGGDPKARMDAAKQRMLRRNQKE